MAIPAINVLGNPNVTEGNFQIAIEDLRKSVIGSGKAYDAANTYSQYDTCVSDGVVYYSKINSNTGNTPAVNANWGLIGDLFKLLITNGTAFGYGTGSGGTVTQLTSKSTSVTLNKPSGLIATANSALAAGASATFTLNNNQIGENDGFYITLHYGYIDPYNYKIEIISTFNGGARVKITNISTGSLSDIVQFKFQILKGVIA